MKYTVLTVLCCLLSLVMGTAIWRYYATQKNPLPVYCSSESRFVQGTLSVSARYIVLFNHGSGMFSINGVASDGAQQQMISRQVHFIYRHSGEGFTLESTQIERLHENIPESHPVTELLPSFFSTGGRFLTLAMDRDQYDNRLLTFGDLPVFYCVPRRGVDKE
ncbi:hypothetical protein F9C28_13090 [Shimwellia pseudoproteus]|uniref:hypothetical protein n=1 Tax=Shimwellia pseudoproteus TaxID=570012 RepID=UPI0018EBAE3E|nr:hypothetical protein [Shimwellia pseudoproteus]MBJ3815842.1 hypothetical protein [Shimwellia pseudoproteus]